MSEDEWRDLIRAQASLCSSPLLALTYRNKTWGTSAGPCLLACSDGHDYVVKGDRLARCNIAEHVVAHLGRAMDAPVPIVRMVEVTSELISIQKELSSWTAGIWHGSRLEPDTRESRLFDFVDSPENRERLARLAILYGWMMANDRQLIYRKTPPELLFSVDHGLFFPDNWVWSCSSLARAGEPVPDPQIVRIGKITTSELVKAAGYLGNVSNLMIAEAVACLPTNWVITEAEKICLAIYLSSRRDKLIDGMMSWRNKV